MTNFNNKVVYQIYPKSFMDTNNDGIGDIKGIISKLDYLKNLGVDYIWLSPINTSPQHDNGYDIADYYGIDPMFGTKEDYFLLIKEAKERGIKIMLDLVLNHTSSEHEWFQKAINGEKKYQDYYIWTDQPNELIGYFSKSAWTYNEQVGKYYLHLFDQHQPDLNWQNPELRQEIYKMVNYWIDHGVEGFRLDVIDLIGKEPEKMITTKGPKFYEYLEELHLNTFKDKILTVGECWQSSLEDSHKMCDHHGLTEVFHFSQFLLSATNNDKFIQQKLDYQQLADVMTHWNNLYDSYQTVVMNNHDLPRLISLWMNDDEYRYESATNLALIFSFMRGTQYIYQGEEIGMTNLYEDDINKYNDVETINYYQKFKDTVDHDELMTRIKNVSRDNARCVMQWDDTEFAGFSNVTPWIHVNKNKDDINVYQDLNSVKSVYKFYQDLLRFKKENYDLYIDTDIIASSFENNILTIEKENLYIISNTSDQTITSKLPTGKIIFNNSNSTSNKLMPYQALIILK